MDENEYDIKYGIPHAHMFVMEGMDKVRDVIEKNRKRKLTKHKKLPNHTIIEIDNCPPIGDPETPEKSDADRRAGTDFFCLWERKKETGDSEAL